MGKQDHVMAIGTKLGRLALKNWVRYKDIKPTPTQSDLPTPTFATVPLPRNYRAGLVTSRANSQVINIAIIHFATMDCVYQILAHL